MKIAFVFNLRVSILQIIVPNTAADHNKEGGMVPVGRFVSELPRRQFSTFLLPPLSFAYSSPSYPIENSKEYSMCCQEN